MSELMDLWMCPMDGWLSGWVAEWTDGWTKRRVDEWMNGWTAWGVIEYH